VDPSAAQEAEALSYVGMLPRRSRKEAVPARFAAEAKSPVGIGDEPKPSTAVCTTIFRLGHEPLPAWRLIT